MKDNYPLKGSNSFEYRVFFWGDENVLELQRDWAREETYDAVNTLIKKSGGAYGLGIQYAHTMLQAKK